MIVLFYALLIVQRYTTFFICQLFTIFFYNYFSAPQLLHRPQHRLGLLVRGLDARRGSLRGAGE
jgi:hypothetical protein